MDWPLNKKTTESQALLNTASAKENLEEFHAQAFDDPTVRARDLSSSKRQCDQRCPFAVIRRDPKSQ